VTRGRSPEADIFADAALAGAACACLRAELTCANSADGRAPRLLRVDAKAIAINEAMSAYPMAVAR